MSPGIRCRLTSGLDGYGTMTAVIDLLVTAKIGVREVEEAKRG